MSHAGGNGTGPPKSTGKALSLARPDAPTDMQVEDPVISFWFVRVFQGFVVARYQPNELKEFSFPWSFFFFLARFPCLHQSSIVANWAVVGRSSCRMRLNAVERWCRGAHTYVSAYDTHQ